MARNVVRFDPFAELEALQRQLFGDDALAAPKAVSVPTTDVYTQGDELVVESHLPNFSENDVEVSLDGGALTIQAQKQEREEEDKKKRKRYVVRESSQSFYRRIPLPDRADESRISAKFENGVLKVLVPFKELPSPKRIAISTGQESTGSNGPAEGQSSGS
jgi:HSP20 family protein